ncbi:MAG: hypothetical protein LBN05_06005 [Oscillospiraceae bacterium]|nr:hypothetical protein [Oscillospiraceae bacterium]
MEKTMRHCTVIYNPIASRFDNELLVKVLERLKDEDYTTTVVKSNRAGAVVPLVKEYNGKCDLILTMGGDGTVSEAINGFFGAEQLTTYAHLSMGTTNDVGRSLGLIHNDPLTSLELILSGAEKGIDIMSVNGKPFFYVSCFGYVSEIPYKTPTALKRRLGHAAYAAYFVATSLKRMPRRRAIHMIADGVEIEGESVLSVISNSHVYAGVSIYPNADLSDGIFELALLERLTPALAGQIFTDYLKGHVDLNKYPSAVHTLQAKELILEFDNVDWDADLDNDGECVKIPRTEKCRLVYRVAGQIRMLLPR